MRPCDLQQFQKRRKLPRSQLQLLLPPSLRLPRPPSRSRGKWFRNRVRLLRLSHLRPRRLHPARLWARWWLKLRLGLQRHGRPLQLFIRQAPLWSSRWLRRLLAKAFLPKLPRLRRNLRHLPLLLLSLPRRPKRRCRPKLPKRQELCLLQLPKPPRPEQKFQHPQWLPCRPSMNRRELPNQGHKRWQALLR
jgi:hypothetical protein